MTLLDDIENHRHESDRHRENSCRLAMAFAVFKSTGQGTTEYGKRVDFGLTFIEKPVVAYGSVCDLDALDELLDLDSETDDQTPLPVCTGYVTQWDQDERGFYLGCWIAARVNFPTIDLVPPEAMPEIEHHFTFSAFGMKDIPPDLGDA